MTIACEFAQFNLSYGIEHSELYILTISKPSLSLKTDPFCFNLFFSKSSADVSSVKLSHYEGVRNIPKMYYSNSWFKHVLLICIEEIDDLAKCFLSFYHPVPKLKEHGHIFAQDISQFDNWSAKLVDSVFKNELIPSHNTHNVEILPYYPWDLKITRNFNHIFLPYQSKLHELYDNSQLSSSPHSTNTQITSSDEQYTTFQSNINLKNCNKDQKGKDSFIDITAQNHNDIEKDMNLGDISKNTDSHSFASTIAINPEFRKVEKMSESIFVERNTLQKSKELKKIKGLKNINMICYMNAVLQTLFNAPEFAYYFLNGEYNKDLNPNYPGVLSHLFAETLKRTHGLVDYSASDNENRDLEDLAHILRFWTGDRFETIKNRTQHDSIEFFKVLLEGLSQELNKVHETPPYKQLSCARDEHDFQIKSEEWFQNMLSRENSIVTDLFCGQILNVSTCNNCSSLKGSFEPFWDLALSLNKACFKSENKLENLLKDFLKEEKLGTDQAECYDCSNGNITMETRIWRLPKILIFTFKRFKNNFGAWQKIDDTINFPVKELDLSSYVKHSKDESTKDAKYTLFGMVEHYGNLEFGHYTARCMNLLNQKWYSLNDESVKELSNISKETPDFTCSPSILFYVKSSVLSSCRV